ncbi:DEAD/DEAH box helicase [Nakamurella lactea]|uniref:DEAD/DEAH box helicase n=1 Tax=Nakamurella lactea TaxID=459515 RepID=UPI00040C13F5|nr:DEAD/DEAH box helicase [Nakamurella lactea]
MGTGRRDEITYPDESLSPAERFARSRDLARHPLLAEFAAARPFVLDEFQIDGCRALEDGRGVLICAPTGAGKTVVGEFAVFRALATGGKCFYTTPIKALSNQKYADLVAEHGAAKVGLLTGDVAINSHAPVVVMTTEVLRNMLYAGSADLAGLTAVVMDEIHYLADKFRGAVWEEVILHLPEQVQVAGLSATVSNAEEFGAWLQQVRGDTTVVVDEVRPVPLWQHMMVGRRLYDLFRQSLTPDTAAGARVQIDPALARAVADAEPRWAHATPVRGRGRSGSRQGGGPARRPSNRVDVIERLDGAGLLPAITFIFSRAGCEAAVAQCVRSGLRLVSDAERVRIREVVDARADELPEADLGVLGFWEWREALERGIAAHHAGMLPAFKETVEKLFVAGLVKAVFATETLALGINMPARTVVLEKLVKYNGESHVDLTPGEYTQLTGRAGRRGIDVEGHAVVIWSPGLDPRQVGGLASKRTYPLRSSFGPSYNMAVNLIERLGRAAAKDLLQQSFAQFQADAGVVGLARQVRRGEESIAEHNARIRCHLGDVEEYFDLLSRLTGAEKDAARDGAARRKRATALDLAQLKRGDVIEVPAGRRAGLAVVLDPGVEIDGVSRPLVVTADRWSGRLSQADFRGPVPALGRIRLAKQVNHRSPQVRRDIASSIAAVRVSRPDGRGGRDGSQSATGTGHDRGADGSARTVLSEADLTALRKAIRAHPVHGCADRESHLQWIRRRNRLAAETANLRRRVDGARDSLGDQLDRILLVLADRGYLHEDELTDSGRMLSRIWSESDLLATECLNSGVWDELSAPDLAAAVSALVYEARREVMARPVPGPAGAAISATVRLWAELATQERAHELRVTREPDAGFAGAIGVWARGGTLAEALEIASVSGVEMPAGDFVRWSRQVIDLLDQIHGAVAGPVGQRAREAVGLIRRGVVSLGAR